MGAAEQGRQGAPAQRGDWKILPLAAQRADIRLTRRYSADDMARIRRGLIPREMEDKWFAYVEGETLHLHRSWTGFQIYQVTFAADGDGFVAARAEVTRDPEQYRQTDDDADARALESLIDALLIHRLDDPHAR